MSESRSDSPKPLPKSEAKPLNYGVGPLGNPVILSDEQVTQGSLNNPVSYQTAKDLAVAEANRKAVDENWGTGGKIAAGLASGVTLGLGPAIAARMGALDVGELEAAQETGLYQGADLAGMVAPAILSGGTAVEGRGALSGAGRIAAALSPAGAMTSAGGYAERLAGKMAMEGAAGKLFNPALRMASRGATEGAIINAAHTASDAIMHDRPLTVAALAASGVEGALFGGLAGGVLGGIGGGASALAGAVRRGAGGSAEALTGATTEIRASKVLKQMGFEDAEIAGMRGGDGGLAGAARRYYKLMGEEGANFRSGPQGMAEAGQKAVARHEAVIADTFKTLGETAPNSAPNVASTIRRLHTEFDVYYGSTAFASDAQRFVQKEIGDRLTNIGTGMGKNAATGTWDVWSRSREQIVELSKTLSGPRADMAQKAITIIDQEIGSAAAMVDQTLADKLAAARVSKIMAQEFADATSKSAAKHAGSYRGIKADSQDAGYIAAGFFAGHPLVGAGGVAGKHLVQYAVNKLSPILAEWGARSVVGAEAGAAVAHTRAQLSQSVRKFLGLSKDASTQAIIAGSMPDTKAAVKAKYSVKSLQEALAVADELTSLRHQENVKQYASTLADMGHPEVAQEILNAYGRSVAYIAANRPKNTALEKGSSSLGKIPSQLGPDTKQMRFMRISSAIRDPLGSLVRGIENGSISRDEVRAIKFTLPALHQEMVSQTAQAILEVKQAGKFVPADKLALLGTVLDYPVDSKLEKSFIDGVQAGLAANNSPPPKPDAPQPPVTDVSSYQTPLQSSVT